MKYISNAFSPKMLNPNLKLELEILPTTLLEIQQEKDELISAIGHTMVAEYLDIEKNRINIQLEKNDILYIVQTSPVDDNEYLFKKNNNRRLKT